MKKVIYLAGAMNGLDYTEMNNWRYDTKSRIEDLSSDWVCFNPVEHFMTSSLHTELEAMKMDLWKLEHSDVMICDLNHQSSLGTSAELGICYSRNIPVIGFCSNENRATLHPWWLNIPLVICEDEDDALLYFITHFINED